MKVLVIGLDCAEPSLLFDGFLDHLPALKGLIAGGIHGRLRTTIPAITIPAWMVMATGQDPGTLGLYGFRHRKNNSYTDIWIADSSRVREPTVWDIAGDFDRRVCLVGVPPAYPPRPVNGEMVSCFITPDPGKEYTHPPELKGEIERLVGEYIFDVEFRTEDRDALLRSLYEMTGKHMKVIRHLLRTREWDLFWSVEIGIDRLHHGFWKYHDRAHPRYEAGSPYEGAMLDYYRYIDGHIGAMLDLLDEDTAVLVVSDHGAKRMKGAFCMNEWLIREGYLVLNRYPEEVCAPGDLDIDWSRTRAWAWGGYYARIFLNLEGREPNGVVPREEYDALRDELAERVMGVPGPAGEPLRTRVFRPEDIYTCVRGDPPDLMVYLDDLHWRSAGTVGHRRLYLEENDTGPDDAVHSGDGVFILCGPGIPEGRTLDVDIMDIAPTILTLMGIPVPENIRGRSVVPGGV